MKCLALTISRLASYLIAGIFASVLASQALAQGPPPGQGPPSNNDPSFGDRAQRIGEEGLRKVELVNAADAENQKTLATAVANVKTDFTRIQVLRNDIARNLVARKPIDYELVRLIYFFNYWIHQSFEISYKVINIYFLFIRF